jgi:hypothetical protein
VPSDEATELQESPDLMVYVSPVHMVLVGLAEFDEGSEPVVDVLALIRISLEAGTRQWTHEGLRGRCRRSNR